MNKKTILTLLEQIKQAEKSGEDRLPQNSFYLDYDKVVCCSRDTGESRYPYDGDGLMVWLRSTGFIDALESNFTIFKTANFGEESAVNFFAGIKNGENDYTPVSITGSSRGADQKGVNRYILYSLKCAYCFLEVANMVFALRIHVSEDKHIHFSLNAVNTASETKEFYIASFMEAILRYAENEYFWNRLTKYGKHYDKGSFILKSRNAPSHDSLIINSKICSGTPTNHYYTTARNDFLGTKGLSIANAVSLRRGCFDKQSANVATTDLPIASDIFHFSADSGECVRIEYDLSLCHSNDELEAEKYINNRIDAQSIDEALQALEAKETAEFDNLKIRFKGWKSDIIDAETFNKFLRSVQKQVTICAHGKNYAGAYLGIRDVFQQLEGALIWKPEVSREKIVTALNYILTSGRAPRMFSVPDDPSRGVAVSLEKYIDQGVWIISTVYTYLAYTGDYSILDEECGYIEHVDIDNDYTTAKVSDERDNVLCHLKRIMNFLLSNIDNEYKTGCMRVLFGDWNDAVDGLGETEDEGKEFGSGVTVMATLQFYQNLHEMTEIMQRIGDNDQELLAKYANAMSGIEKGLEQHAIDINQKGERRIVHGWGDKIGYKVGSWCDPDGVDRYSMTSNSFWAITKFLTRDPSLKESIMNCVNAVSSKYGLKTFNKPFPEDTKGVGRITRLVPGTYENSCAYVHGSLFATMALFEMGEGERAWAEIEKSSVITHDNCTMTTFVMPNSYCENAEYGIDGESMGDWHTGSGTVLIKETVRYGFGIYPTLDGLLIQTPKYFPAISGEITLNIKSSKVTLHYEDKHIGSRNIEIIGADNVTKQFDNLMGIDTYFIPESEMGSEIKINITD
ncbi:MAG: hypothetical protein Q4B40_06305 [Clostridia bacterium]|nr:hypothetical protein [Clostridia bacterium]